MNNYFLSASIGGLSFISKEIFDLSNSKFFDKNGKIQFSEFLKKHNHIPAILIGSSLAAATFILAQYADKPDFADRIAEERKSKGLSIER